jgi:capsule polysaccharide export protein KpsE/RkpR
VADSLIAEFHLLERYEVDDMEAARRALGAAAEFGLASAGLLRISIEDEDPQVAADMANALVRHLDRVNRVMRMGEGKRTRIFIESRLQQTRGRLRGAEDSLLAFERSHPGVLLPDDASDLGGANLMSRRISVGAELEVLRSFFHTEAPAVSRKAREAEALDRELEDLPAVELELVRRYRDLKIQERVFEFLTAQFEQAQIQENRDIATVEVLDPAVPPVRKSSPRRWIMTALAFLLSTVVGSAVVISQEALADLRLRDDFRLRTVVQRGSLLDRLLFGWKSGPST